MDARTSDADSAAAAKGVTDDSVSTGGWTTLASPNQSVNLLAYQAGAALPLGSKPIAAGGYLGFRLIIDATKSSIVLFLSTVAAPTSPETATRTTGVPASSRFPAQLSLEGAPASWLLSAALRLNDAIIMHPGGCVARHPGDASDDVVADDPGEPAA